MLGFAIDNNFRITSKWITRDERGDWKIKALASSSFLCFVKWYNRVGNPGEVGRGAARDGQGDDFGDVVAVQALHFGFQLGETRLGGLDDEQEFLGGFYSSIPAVN